MNDTRSMNRERRVSVRFAVVLCLLLAIGAVPMAAFAAPKTVSDVEATYLNSATINLTATGSIADTHVQLDGGAIEVGTSVTTSVYGSHVLKFCSTDTSGTVEATVTAPFFVDEDVAPELDSDCKAEYTTSAAFELEATDNFNGSGVDFLCYRVDGGPIVTAMAPAQLAAAKKLIAQLATVKVQAAKMGPNIDVGVAAPANHFAQGTDLPVCLGCHDYNIVTPEPTSTPDPTGTPAPEGGVACDVAVTGVGNHTVEYWAQDVARNVTDHVVEDFAIVEAAPPTPVSTSLTLMADHTSLRVGKYVGLSSVLSGGVPAGTHVRYQVRLPHKSAYTTISSTRDVSATGASSVRYKLTKKGTYYFRVRFFAIDGFTGSMSGVVKVVVK